MVELQPAAEDIFSPEARAFQDRFDTRRLADRLVEHFVRRELDDEQTEFIRGCRMLFLATVGADGRPDCSYKGGRPGFVRVGDATTLVIPFYDGNGMFCALGNIEATGRVGLLFIDFESSYRLRVNGRAVTSAPQDAEGEYPGAIVLVTIHSEVVYDLCERYVHRLTFVQESSYYHTGVTIRAMVHQLQQSPHGAPLPSGRTDGERRATRRHCGRAVHGRREVVSELLPRCHPGGRSRRI